MSWPAGIEPDPRPCQECGVEVWPNDNGDTPDLCHRCEQAQEAEAMREQEAIVRREG